MTRSSRILMAVEPQRRITEVVWREEWRCSYSTPSLTFWEWLQSPFLRQLEHLAFAFLQRRGLIEKKRLREELYSYTTYEIDLDEIVKETFECVEDYLFQHGYQPNILFVGRDVHRQLVLNVPPNYAAPLSGRLPDGTPAQQMFMGMRIVITPRLKGMFAWNSDRQ